MDEYSKDIPKLNEKNEGDTGLIFIKEKKNSLNLSNWNYSDMSPDIILLVLMSFLLMISLNVEKRV